MPSKNRIKGQNRADINDKNSIDEVRYNRFFEEFELQVVCKMAAKKVAGIARLEQLK